jgi:hypothetical protein
MKDGPRLWGGWVVVRSDRLKGPVITDKDYKKLVWCAAKQKMTAAMGITLQTKVKSMNGFSAILAQLGHFLC